MKPIILAAAVYLVVDTCTIAACTNSQSIWFYAFIVFRVALILLLAIVFHFLP
jgi:hypothetical protein